MKRLSHLGDASVARDASAVVLLAAAAFKTFSPGEAALLSEA